MNRQNFAPGDIIKINLGDGAYAYGRVISGLVINFYELRTTSEYPLKDVVSKHVLFQVPVMNRATKRWVVIGNIPLNQTESKVQPRFMQDIINPADLRIYEDGITRPATKAQCQGLEREAIWDPEHVEDRLNDYFLGRKNKWVESLELK